jgi:hypothetical protein
MIKKTITMTEHRMYHLKRNQKTAAYYRTKIKSEAGAPPRVEVCTDLGLALGPRPDPARGPGLVAQIMFESGPGSGLVIIIAIKHYIEYFGLSRAILFSQKEVVCSCAHRMLVTQSGSGNKSHRLDFLGDFRSCHLPEIVRDNTLQT